MRHHADSTDHAGGQPTTWHVCWQAAIGRELFTHPVLYVRVRDRLIQAHRRRGRVLVDYLLLPTEIHVIARLQADETPGDLARAIGNVVARWVREAQSFRSPAFAGPFHAHQLHSESELLEEVRTLGWRPVVLGLSKGPAHHAQGALRAALGMTPAHGFDARPLLQLFGASVVASRAALRAWMKQRPTEREWRNWELARGLALAQGSVGPHLGMAHAVRSTEAAALIAAAGPEGIDGALGLLSDWVTVRLGGPGTLQIHKGVNRAAVRGRALVARLATEHRLCSAASVARYFGRAKATLSEQMTASRARPTDQQIVATPVPRIIEEALTLATAKRSSGKG